ncbi:Hypothetical protein D9617_8g050570 [Elsinoe fawcettii]|nr:Hypothetical protein D9617_8g050570 [Elsinoe fawcettii]
MSWPGNTAYMSYEDRLKAVPHHWLPGLHPLEEVFAPQAWRFEDHKFLDLSKSLFTEMVKVIVGEEEKEFYVSGNMLCAYSDFFVAALNPAWEEGQTGTIRLPDEFPHAFEYFVRYAIGDCSFPHFSMPNEDISNSTFIDIYIMADKYDIPSMRNIAIDVIQLRLRKYHQAGCYMQAVRFNRSGVYYQKSREELPFTVEDLIKVFDRLPEKSGLQRLVVDWFTIMDEILEGLDEQEEAVAELMLAVEKRKIVRRHAYAIRARELPVDYHG